MLILSIANARPQSPPVLAVRIGVLGNPVHLVEWTDGTVEKLRSVGFNEVQLNIAWGPRPFDEALNLADVVTVQGEQELSGTAERRGELKRRLALAKRHGMRTMLTFGSPYTNFDPNTRKITHGPRLEDDAAADPWYEILNPKVRAHEVDLLRVLRREFPQLDDILVYTYDNDSWQTPEFQFNRFSYGVPLASRLPGYLRALYEVWTEGRAGKVRMWWEPWELSAGQVYATLPQLPRKDFGLIVHGNLAEAQLALPGDVWLRNTARICREFGIPVVVESFFASTSEELEPLSIPAPRLVDEEYSVFAKVGGVVGIKEYYGINVDSPDLDADVLQARLREPSRSTDQLLEIITRRYGGAQRDVRVYLNLLADAIQVYPWDASWLARDVGRASVDHGWDAATIQGASWMTPAWQATRHAKFMKTDGAQPHFWMLEDVQLRCGLAADIFGRATNLSVHLLQELSDRADRAQFQQIQRNVETLTHVSRSYMLHLRETNVAQMLRQDLDAGRPMTAALVQELEQLLTADVANQGGHGRVLEMRERFVKSPEQFVRKYLLPTDKVGYEKGMFTLTTR